MPGMVLFDVRVSVLAGVLYAYTLPLWRSIYCTTASGDELAFPALRVTTSPGTTGPALIFTNLAPTAIGIPGDVVVDSPVVVSPDESGAFCPATGKLALPTGATAMPAEPVKNMKYAAAPNPRTTITIAAMIK